VSKVHELSLRTSLMVSSPIPSLSAERYRLLFNFTFNHLIGHASALDGELQDRIERKLARGGASVSIDILGRR